MRIALFSDLHLSVQGLEHPRPEVDVVVLAGDLGRPAAAMAWARQYEQPTLFVAGNHEFYGSDLQTTYALLREHAQGSTVRVLENNAWVHQGVRFLGCTLWSDHRLYESPEQKAAGLEQAMSFNRDFTRIRLTADFDQLLSPAACQMLFDQSVAWLEEQFAQPHDGPTVVVTHFAPARGSIHPRFAGSPLNACFVSDLQERILRWQPQLWLHGHTHDSFDYRVGATRVVANPRGYAPKGEIENKAFDPQLVLEV